MSSLSPEQLQQVQSQRDEYLTQMPNPNDSTAEELTKRLLAASSVEIYKAYLAQLKELYVPIERTAEFGTDFDTARNIRFFNITKWVVDKSENSLEKLVNVYEVLSNEDCNISLVFHRTCEKTNVFLAVTNTKNANNNVVSENFRIRLAMPSKVISPALNGQKKLAQVSCLVWTMIFLTLWQLRPMFPPRSPRSLSARQSRSCWMVLSRISAAKSISSFC